MSTAPVPVRASERRLRILAAAGSLAAEGGFERVQMRTVADLADVALGTVYRHFPSKIELLVALLTDSLRELSAHLRDAPPKGETPVDRIEVMLRYSADEQYHQPLLAGALTHAYVQADPSCGEAAIADALVESIVCVSIRGDALTPTAVQADAAAVIADSWLSSAIGLANGRLTPDEARDRVLRAARLVVGD